MAGGVFTRDELAEKASKVDRDGGLATKELPTIALVPSTPNALLTLAWCSF